MTPKELEIYTMGWNMGLTAAASALRCDAIRKDATREDLAAHVESMIVKMHDESLSGCNVKEKT